MTTYGSNRDDMIPGLQLNSSDIHRQRLKFIFPLFLIVFTLIILRLVHIHVFPSERLAEELDYHLGRVLLDYPRGEIFDRNGIVLATSVGVPSVYVDPRKITDEMKLLHHLSVHLDMDEEEIWPRLARTSRDGVVRQMYPVKRWITDLSETELRNIVAFEKSPLYLQYESIRRYPHNDSAAHLLGFVNRAGEASEGVELAFDEHLQSRQGKILARKDSGKQLLPSQLVDYQQPEGGEMVQLTLDINIQHTLESALDRRMEEVGAKAAMGMLMDPHTGAILALASRPAFNPNEYDSYPAELRKNRALLDVFEPGSAFKIVTAAAALEHGIVTPDQMIDCEGGAFNPYGHRIKDFYKLGVIPFSRAFEKSSNIAVIKLAANLGPERLEEWIRQFGFAEKTSPDFQFESRGLFQPRNKWSRLSMGSLPMGQEIAVTIPQMAKAFAVIANGGHVVQPYFVEQSVDRYGNVTYKYTPPPAKRILSPETAKTMQELCHRVVLFGTGTAANIPEYRAGGKTGTAQMARIGGRGYDPDRYTTVFSGFAPVADPRVVAVIVIQEPSIRERWGGFVCGPVFKEVVRDALIRMNVPEDPVRDPDKEQDVPPLLARRERAVQQQIDKFEEKTLIEEFGDIDTLVPRPAPEDLDADLEALIIPLERLALQPGRVIDESSERAMPDLSGLSKSQAREQLQRLGAIMDARGAGWVVAQDPPPGTIVEVGMVCGLQFGDKLAGGSNDDTG